MCLRMRVFEVGDVSLSRFSSCVWLARVGDGSSQYHANERYNKHDPHLISHMLIAGRRPRLWSAFR
jgi:hypothetical protein